MMDFSTDFYKKLFTNLNSNAVLLKIDEKDKLFEVLSWLIDDTPRQETKAE